MIEKSANQLWRESGTTLSFKNWLNREKTKFLNYGGSEAPLMVNKPLNDTIEQTIGSIRDEVGFKSKATGKTTFGISNTILVVVGLVSVGFITYKLINKKK